MTGYIYKYSFTHAFFREEWIPLYQFGFREHHSTLKQIHRKVNLEIKYLNAKNNAPQPSSKLANSLKSLLQGTVIQNQTIFSHYIFQTV